MNASQPVNAFALLSDRQGNILEILCDPAGLLNRLSIGQPWMDLADDADHDKAVNFQDEFKIHPLVPSWQINMQIAGHVEPLHMAGGVYQQGLLLIGARRRDDLEELSRLLVAQDAAQSHHLKEILDEILHHSWRSAGRDEALYDELTRLNNDLAGMQRELAKKNVELERLNQIKNQFLGMAAHDLRNPIAVILLYSEFLEKQISGRLSAEELEFIVMIHQKSEFMLQLINDLLDVSKIESGRLDLELVSTDLAALVEHNVALNRALAAKKGIKLEFQSDANLPGIQIDPPKIEQVLDNLLSNAIKYSQPDSTVSVRLSWQDRQVILTVLDQGVGIAENEIGQLFRPFARLKARGTGGEKSTGLGLVICRRIVEGHKGKIWVESQPGQGTSFYIALPCGQGV